MRKTILLMTIAALMLCSTACTTGNNSSDAQSQSSTEEKVSSTDSAQESKPETEKTESVSQTTSSEATSTDPVSETQSDTDSTASTPESPLDEFIGELDGYDFGIAFLGYSETEDVNSVRECAQNSLTAAKYAFISDIPDDKIILAGGGEVYCIIPANTDAKVAVNSLEYDENAAEVVGDELYSGDSAPILLCCNVSDIMPNAAVSITNGENTVKYNPFLSLRDGHLSLPEDMAILDFSEYDF